MARYYGMVGFSEMRNDGFGVYTQDVVERPYYGDVIRNTKRNETGDGINDDLNIQNDISIVADAYAYQNFHQIQYVIFMGTRWKVHSVSVERPRLVLSIGGVYNGSTPRASSEVEGSSGD